MIKELFNKLNKNKLGKYLIVVAITYLISLLFKYTIPLPAVLANYISILLSPILRLVRPLYSIIQGTLVVFLTVLPYAALTIFIIRKIDQNRLTLIIALILFVIFSIQNVHAINGIYQVIKYALSNLIQINL